MLLNPVKAYLSQFGLLLLLLAMMSSCSVSKRTSIKGFPDKKPFVYENLLSLKGNLTKDEKNRLTSELGKYWDDSLQVPKVQQFGFFYKIKNPPIFDSANIARTITFMNAYLNSQGYYYASFDDSVRYVPVADQIRTTVSIEVTVGKNITIDSVNYQLGDTVLQQLTEKNLENTILKKGTPYTKQIISNELDRLVGIYRQNGYYNFTRDDIYALVDTADPVMLELTLDPFKQAQLIADAAVARMKNPTWQISILKREASDSSKLEQYHIGRVYFYPETRITDITDSIPFQNDFKELNYPNTTQRFRKGMFTIRPLREHAFLLRGDLYDEGKYYKTINTLGKIGAWQQVDARTKKRGKDSMDLYFYLVPSIKYNYTIDLEGSRNSSDIGTGNLWGISTNFSINNKNIWRSAIQSLSTFRTGVELSLLSSAKDQLIQTFHIDLGHTYVFPNLIVPFKNWQTLRNLENKRTLFSMNGSYVNRRAFYQLRSLVTSWGYEWKKNNKVWLFKPLSMEFNTIDTLDGLKQLFITNPFLRTSFNSGRVISQSLSMIKTAINPNNPNKSYYLRLGVEEAGAIFGSFGSESNPLYRFLKIEGEFRKSIKINKSDLAYRFFAGVGYNYGKDTIRDNTLPFFKQFYAGGPYSMRAWGLRQLGLGSSTLYDSDTALSTFRDRFGDMQLEANLEYRFPIATIAGVKVASALFTDMGNVWNVKKNPGDPTGTFKFENLYKDLAVSVGTGIRIDFSFFLIRLDWAYKVKDPARQYNDGWMQKFQWFENRPNGLKVTNYAFQLGIGLPF